jgi:hypothetical protein
MEHLSAGILPAGFSSNGPAPLFRKRPRRGKQAIVLDLLSFSPTQRAHNSNLYPACGKGGPLRIRMHDPRWLYSAQQHLRHAQRRHGFLAPYFAHKSDGRAHTKAESQCVRIVYWKRGDEGVKPLAKDKVEATKSERLQTAPISNA